MSAHEFTLIVFLVSIAAGFLGALTGLGGGIVVTPALTLRIPDTIPATYIRPKPALARETW
jgi:uncharacterized membrane protein YfcA